MNMKVMRVSQIKSDLYCVPSSKFVFLRFFVQDEYVEVSLIVYRFRWEICVMVVPIAD